MPRQLAGPETVTNVEAGGWRAARSIVAAPDPRIRTAYTTAGPDFCVRAGETTSVTLTWHPVPTSHRLWSTNGSGGTGELLGFVAEDLATSGTVGPQDVRGPTGGDVVFDRYGDFWAFGASTSDAMLVHFTAFELGATARPNIEANIDGIECFPRLSAAAAGPGGDLWVSSICANRVVRLLRHEVEAGGLVTPSVVLTGLTSPSALAFDGDGNLWVGDEGGILKRFDAGTLGASTDTASLTITIKKNGDPTDSSTLTGNDLAFDASGALWGSDFGGNVFFHIDPAELAGTGAHDSVPDVQLTLPLRALLEGFAFDEEGGLWTTYGNGQLARLAPAQLTVSTGAGDPTVPATIIEGADIGYLGGVSIYPAPAALPLFHSLP